MSRAGISSSAMEKRSSEGSSCRPSPSSTTIAITRLVKLGSTWTRVCQVSTLVCKVRVGTWWRLSCSRLPPILLRARAGATRAEAGGGSVAVGRHLDAVRAHERGHVQ